jgi:putative SOS response-associated peptidase YedK
MCGRFALKSPPAKLVERFGLDECADFTPRYNKIGRAHV